MEHKPLLDGVRGVAILMVLLEHFGGPVGSSIHSGYFGVDLFFVLSGFLITGILLSEHGFAGGALWRFLGRRVLRIFPLYYVLLAVLWMFNFSFVRRELGWFAAYVWNYRVTEITDGNWLLGEIPPAYPWSLSVEEQFYVFWPFVVLSLCARPLVFRLVSGAIIVMAFVQITFGLFPAIAQWDYTGLPTRMGALALGGLVASIGKTGKVGRLPKWVVVLAGFGAFALMPCGGAWRLPIVTILLSLVVHAAASGSTGLIWVDRVLCNKRLRFLGRISYGVYLLHIPIAYYFIMYCFDPWWKALDWESFGVFEKIRWHSWLVKLPVCSLLSVAVATLSYYRFEKPILSLKDLWFSGKRLGA